MAIAIIDLGTNTFHLLIADIKKNGFAIIHREKQAVKIGAGGINQGLITPDAVSRAIITLSEFKNKIDQYPIKKIFAFGTSAFRNAKNANEVISRIKSETSIEISVISGEKEAEFIYLGIQSALSLGESKSLIMDIGGGSVEFIIGNEHKIFWKKSFEIGGQRLLEQFHKSDPITEAEITQLNTYFDSTLKELFQAMQLHTPSTLVGSSGTFDTLSDIYCISHDLPIDSESPEVPLTISGFYEIYNSLIHKNRIQRLAIPGMIEMRVDMIVVACCLIHYILDKGNFANIRVSSYSLKEGALAYLSNTAN